jgi:pyruvate/2-oxoglutarate dehydrogenase complex dihydrolipoamide dehydrogenase (E3) component
MPEILKPDICVIGAGSGGLTVAAAAAAFGVKVVLIEKGRMGGDCLNRGCVPSKALIAAGKRAEAVRQAALFGVKTRRPGIDFAAVHAHVQAVIAAAAPNDSAERFSGLGVRVIAGAARFKDRRTVAVGDEIEVVARRVVIATGSAPAVPAIPGLDAVPYLTNDTVFDLTECPKHLIIVGAGSTGLELAQAYRRLGAAVTVLDAAEPLAEHDPECTAIVLDVLRREGVAIRPGVGIARIERARGKLQVVLGGEKPETIEGSHILLAAGRVPNTAGLDLAAARIAYGPDGIVVDARLRTANRKVYAIGDVVGGPKSTHRANHHAALVIRQALFRLPGKLRPDEVPTVTYTDPELAQIGLGEAEARRRGIPIRLLRWPYHENDRARAERDTVGHIKVIAHHGGRILGVSIVGAQAGELVTAWSLAVRERLRLDVMADIIVPYPTLSEVGKRAAMSYFGPGLTNLWVRRIIGLLRRLG